DGGTAPSTPVVGTSSASGASGTGAGGAAGDPGAEALLAPVVASSAASISADQASPDPSAQPWSARGPPPGAVLIAASTRGVVAAGDATLTLAPGFLTGDAYVRITPVDGVYDLEAWDAATGAEVHEFLVAPVLTIRTGTLPVAPHISYLDPVAGPQAI